MASFSHHCGQVLLLVLYKRITFSLCLHRNAILIDCECVLLFIRYTQGFCAFPSVGSGKPRKYNKVSPVMARRLPLLSEPMCGPKWSSLSSPLPVQAGVPQGSVLGPVLFLVFINDLSDSLENPLYLFADDSTLCHTIWHPSDRQAATSSLSADLDKITNWSNMWNMSFNPDKSYTLTMSLQKDSLQPPHIYFLNNPVEEVLSFKLLGLTICHDLSWEIPQRKSPTGNPPSCKVLPWPT